MQENRKTLGQRILRAGILVGLAHLLFKLAGLIQAAVMGRYLSPQTYDAAYAFAFENCIFSLFLIAQEVIGPAFLPVFMRELDENGEPAAWRFANTLLTLQLFIIIPAIALLMIAPQAVVALWTDWAPERHAAQIALGIKAVRTLAPALLGLALGTTTYAMLNGYKRFFLAALGDAAWKFAAAGGITFAVIAFHGNALNGLLAGLLLGSVLKIGTHLVGLRDKIGLLRPRLHLNDKAVRAMLWLALPLIVGILFAKVRDIFNNVYILSPLEASGLMQANSMGRKLQSTIHWLVPYTLSIAAFPFFCELVDRRDHKQLGEVLTQSSRMLLAALIPLCVIIAFIATPITALLFKGGQFQDVAVRRTALSMACYTFVLPASAIEALTMQAFFASRRMVSVTVIGILFSAFSMFVSWLGLRFFVDNELLLLGTIAGGFALSRTLKSITLVVLLRRSAPLLPAWPTTLFLLRVALAAACGGLLAWGALKGTALFLPYVPAENLKNLVLIVTVGGAGLVGALLGSLMCGVREPFEMARWAYDKTRGRLKQRVMKSSIA